MRLLRVPYWMISIFGTSKSFRNNPVIGSPRLNRLGLHVFRVVLSHALYRLRLLVLSPLVCAADRRHFREHGFILKENFLPTEQFLALREEVEGYHGPIREIIEGDTETDRLFLTESTRRSLAECERMTRYPPLDRLLRYAGSKNRPPFFYVESIRQHALSPKRPDPQKDCHMDTFHPCVKAWLFLEDVTEANGPFVYVPQSNRLSWKRLRWEYRESLEACADKRRDGPRYWDGSCRITDADRVAVGYAEPIRFNVPANTLVIANVYGFHCRGDATESSSRLAIWMQARDNPFSPLITPFPRSTARVFERVWESILRREDARLAPGGTRGSRVGRFNRSDGHQGD